MSIAGVVRCRRTTSAHNLSMTMRCASVGCAGPGGSIAKACLNQFTAVPFGTYLTSGAPEKRHVASDGRFFHRIIFAPVLHFEPVDSFHVIEIGGHEHRRFSERVGCNRRVEVAPILRDEIGGYVQA